MFHFHMIH